MVVRDESIVAGDVNSLFTSYRDVGGSRKVRMQGYIAPLPLQSCFARRRDVQE